jgi:hypothetical protein
MTIEGSHPVTEDVNRIDIDDESVTAGDEATADDVAATPDLDEVAVAAGAPDMVEAAEEQAVAEAADADLATDDAAYAAPAEEAPATTPSDDEYLEMESMQGDGELPIDMGHEVRQPVDDEAVAPDAAPDPMVDAPVTATDDAPS